MTLTRTALKSLYCCRLDESLCLENIPRLADRYLDGLQEVKRGRREYDKLKTARRGLRLSFMATLTMAFVMVLLAIIWGSLSLGQRLTRPLTRLIEIASEVGRGNFSRRLKNTFGNDEISRLNCSFNKMVEDLDLSHRQAGERQEAISKANTYLENLLASLSSGCWPLIVRAGYCDLMKVRSAYSVTNYML